MSKSRSLLGLALLWSFLPLYPVAPAAAQSTAAQCTDPDPGTPMQGHYTGTWHSSGDYHFDATFPANATAPAVTKDVEMQILIDGALDVTVQPNGQIEGTLTGNVNAPISHDGQQDLSSGYGTISGQVSGVFAGNGSQITVSSPTLTIHWGTFGGHAITTQPVMSNFQVNVGSMDCVSAGGTSSEQGFPDMYLTSDGTGQMTEAPGIGISSGTWQITSDKASDFQTLSQQLDAFTQQATAILNGNPDTATLQQQVLIPLHDLQSRIAAEPQVARCLLQRLHSWEAQAVPALYQHVRATTPTDISDLRQARNMLALAATLNSDCNLPDNGAFATVQSAALSILDQAVMPGDWASAALLVRESLLDGTPGGVLQTRVFEDLHAARQRAPGSLDAARFALALGDRGDALAQPAFLSRNSTPWKPVKPHHHRKHTRTKPTPPPTVSPVASSAPPPTATPTATSGPTNSVDSMEAGITVMQARRSGQTFAWQSISGAARYVLIVNAGAPVYAWSGPGTAVSFGDTTLDGAASLAPWPVSTPADITWSVLALDAAGHVVGAAFNLD